MRRLACITALTAVLAAGAAFANDEAAKKELAPTGTLRVGVATAPNPGAGNVGKDAKTGALRGVAIDLGRELAQKLGVPVVYVEFAHSGALTDAADANAWDVAFIPVDAERKKRVAFGPAHIVLQSTFLVPPGSAIKSLADVDKPGTRVYGVENTATTRAAQAFLKAVKVENVKSGSELFEILRTGKADAVAQSRESLTAMAAKLPGARVIEGAYLNSFVAVAVPRGKPAALAYATAFVEAAKSSGSVRRSLDAIGLRSSTVAPAGPMPD